MLCPLIARSIKLHCAIHQAPKGNETRCKKKGIQDQQHHTHFAASMACPRHPSNTDRSTTSAPACPEAETHGAAPAAAPTNFAATTSTSAPRASSPTPTRVTLTSRSPAHPPAEQPRRPGHDASRVPCAVCRRAAIPARRRSPWRQTLAFAPLPSAGKERLRQERGQLPTPLKNSGRNCPPILTVGSDPRTGGGSRSMRRDGRAPSSATRRPAPCSATPCSSPRQGWVGKPVGVARFC